MELLVPQSKKTHKTSLAPLPSTFFALFLLTLHGGNSSIALAATSKDMRKEVIQQHITTLEAAVIEFRRSQPQSIVELNREYQKCTELIRSSKTYLPVKRAGVMQEIYLTLLTKIIRGANFTQGATPGPGGASKWTQDSTLGWNLTSLAQFDLANNISPAGGAKQFKSILKKVPLDQHGLGLLKSFLLAYEGVEASDIFRNMLEAIEQKEPTNYKYTSYDYISTKEQGRPNFSYEVFNYDPKKEQIIASSSQSNTTQKMPAKKDSKKIALRNPSDQEKTSSMIKRFETTNITEIIDPLDQGMAVFSPEYPQPRGANTIPALSIPLPKKRWNNSRIFLTFLRTIIPEGPEIFRGPALNGPAREVFYTKNKILLSNVPIENYHRMGPSWTMSSSLLAVTDSGRDKGGAYVFKEILRMSPLDQRGLAELEEFLSLYKDHLPGHIWQDLWQSIQGKAPVDFTYAEPPERFMRKAMGVARIITANQPAKVAASADRDRIRNFSRLMQKKSKGQYPPNSKSGTTSKGKCH